MQRCPPPHQQEEKKGIESKRRTALHQTNSSFKTLSHITVHKTEGLREVATELTATRSATDAKSKTQGFSQKTEQKASHWKIRTTILFLCFISLWLLLYIRQGLFRFSSCNVCNNYNILVPNEPKCTKKRFCVTWFRKPVN